jgi:hypothetical protein
LGETVLSRGMTTQCRMGAVHVPHSQQAILDLNLT